LKNNRAADVEERLKLQVLVGKLSDDIKRKDQEVCDLRKKVQPIYLPLSKPSDLHLEFKKSIEKIASNLFSSKHNKTKAEILMEVMQDHMLFGGELANSLRMNANQVI
jgi:hypothetical protein